MDGSIFAGKIFSLAGLEAVLRCFKMTGGSAKLGTWDVLQTSDTEWVLTFCGMPIMSCADSVAVMMAKLFTDEEDALCKIVSDVFPRVSFRAKKEVGEQVMFRFDELWIPTEITRVSDESVTLYGNGRQYRTDTGTELFRRFGFEM